MCVARSLFFRADLDPLGLKNLLVREQTKNYRTNENPWRVYFLTSVVALRRSARFINNRAEIQLVVYQLDRRWKPYDYTIYDQQGETEKPRQTTDCGFFIFEV